MDHLDVRERLEVAAVEPVGCDRLGAGSGDVSARGGAANGPAAVYALRKYMEWLKAYAPPEASGMTFSEAGPVPANSCQTITLAPA